MSLTKSIATALLLFTLTSTSLAQDSLIVEEPIPTIKVLAKVSENEILLRWAPDNAALWHYAIQYGYTVERLTLFRDGKPVLPEESIVLTPEGIKPASEDRWAKAEKNKYNAVTWQAIFGDDFQVNESDHEMLKIKNQSDVLQSRYSLALFSCDYSFEAAELSGLLFRDNTVRKNEKYLYRVYADVTKEIMLADTGSLYADAGMPTVYPKPLELSAEFRDRMVKLQWNQLYYKGIYTAWSVERSDDGGKNYARINSNPLVSLNPEKGMIDRMVYIDSLPQNDIRYIYRIIGHTPFGEEGPPSDTVSGTGIEVLKAEPFISKTLINDKGEVALFWEFPADYNARLKGFRIVVAPAVKAVYKTVNAKAIPPDARSFTDPSPLSTGYYKVLAIDLHGREYASQPYMVQPSDSIPPLPPKGLKGLIDSSGTVTVSWAGNVEDDLFGYRLYMSNDLNSEFSQVTKKALKDTLFRFQTTLKTLTENLYVKVSAEDNRFNPSDFSEVLLLKRPDTIPPSPPLIDDFKITDSGIWLHWIRSTSKDVVNHIVFRAKEGEKEWTAIAVFDLAYNLDSYADTSAVPGIMYKYAVLAIDDADNKSDLVRPVKLQMGNKKVSGSVENFKAEIDEVKKCINIWWDLPKKEIKEIQLLRKTGDGNFKTYKRFYENLNHYTDSDLEIHTRYEYRLRIIFADGTSTPFSERAVVEY